jgi:DNA-binding XRE family transcriptional regulator
VSEVELGNRKLDLFEVKDFIAVFSNRNPEVLPLKLVFDNYFPKGNHGTQAIYKQAGTLIYEARVAAEITREELAQVSGINRAALWRMESGSMRIYLLEAWVIARLLRDYSVPFRELDNALSNFLITDTINQLVAS